MTPSSLPPRAAPPTYRGPFTVMTTLFFLWGFMTVWNDVLIPRFKEAFTLNYFEAMLVQFAFFGAYAVGALVYYLVSMFSGDPINRIGYKNGVIVGLLISAAGSVLFHPAATHHSYVLFLLALFVVGLGFAMLQIAANPYVTILGPEETASSRLNLSQAFNSLGTTVGPLIGGWLIFQVFNRPGVHGADSVKIPYLCFAGVFLLLAVVFKFSHLPAFNNAETIARHSSVLRHPHVLFGVGAIFTYVGGEVAVGSAIINFLGTPRIAGLAPESASRFLAYYWGGLMIGRFMGAFALSSLRTTTKRALLVAVPLVGWLVVLYLSGWPTARPYGVLLLILLAAFAAGSGSPQRMIAVFAGVILLLLAAGISGGGALAMWAVLGVGLFCSVMWSNIFSLAIDGLGPRKSQASSLLVMAILGGALLPPAQGWAADHFGIQVSFIVPMIAFAYVGLYGLIWPRLRARLGAA
jgi:FHS family L-fucose permease-like MFS transporter